MYLKSIEIQGFKSFANKTIFEFHNGITCIVGPNGSGKSNVADAVRWVLGEQSAKQLRGASMQDVIFSGTQLRKPQGFASVAITFDNRDHTLNIEYDEVTVTRRVYRSGESEYLLNGNTCRLRDINELFFDTGIGKEGYSIIGQGQIDKILSSRPEDRRELFDEAAGIVKYKYRKAAAQKKLESEQANMIRLGDIMSELEKQTGPLEKKAAAAREYLKLREVLRYYEVNAFVQDTRRTENSLKETEGNLNIAEADRKDAEKKANNLKTQYENEQERLDRLEEQIENSRETVAFCQSEIQEKESKIGITREQIKTEKLRREHAENRLKTLQTESEKRKKEKLELELKRQELNRQIYDATSLKDRAGQAIRQSDSRISELQKAAHRYQEQIIGVLSRKTEVQTESQKYQTMLEQYRIQKAQLNQKLLQSRQEEGRFQAELSSADLRCQTAKTHASMLHEQRHRAETEYDQCRRSLSELQEQYSEQRRHCQVAAAKAESLRNLAERYEGYGNSIRRVMEARNHYPGICGVVADLIQVEKCYETAIETALGGSIQNIVTDTEQTAKELIGYLKKNRLGRATFLPLDAISVRDEFRQQSVLREPGIIGLAENLIRTEPRYQKIFEFLLGKIVVADTIEHAMKAAAKYKRSFRIVTLEGDLLNIGGSMTGGAFKNNSNLLGRNRELEELEQTIVSEKSKLKVLEQKGNEAAQAAKLAEAELSKVREQAQQAALLETEARMNYASAKKRIEEVLAGREQTVIEMRLLEQSVQNTSGSLQTEKRRINELDRELEQIKAQESEERKAIEAAGGRKEQLAKEQQEFELTLVRLAQSDSFLLENLKRIENEEEKSCQETARLKEEMTVFAGAAAEKEREIRQAKDQILRLTEQSEAEQKGLELLTAEKEKVNALLRGFFTRQSGISERISILDKDIFRLRHQKERLDEFLDSQTEYLWSEYEMKPSEARAMYDENGPGRSELRSLIQTQKTKIKALGTINVNAIEEYRELMERWNFMKGQYDDLIVSKESLAQVVEELDAGMRAQFEEKFAQIKEEFDRVFKELFGGGKGTLELIEGEDMIEAGISIISQPPGKKLQNMLQLSGGEKALTAIALLFAIQNLKPSPFCMLDEIEAALDDSNVGRFSKYLHKLTANTQFIVITHRRGTMTSADRLYGITMQEKGVSALVSVNLIEDELDK